MVFHFRNVLLWLALFAVYASNKSYAATIRHTLNISYFDGYVDGVYKSHILGINGQFPGPLIEATMGDTLIVDVLNNIEDGQNTTIHWHGILVRKQFMEDGVNMVSQCPIPAGQNQTYTLNLDQHGTFWYHSHVNSQYTEGLQGPLIIHNTKEVHACDEEIIIILTDWNHLSANELEEWHLSPESRGISPYPNSALINGHGRYPCTFADLQNRTCDKTKQVRNVFKVTADKTYRVRVLNTGGMTAYNFSIDGHVLYTIETDGVDTAKPVPVDIVPIAPGQRYSFLITTNSSTTDGTRFLIRADVRKEALMLIAGANINKYPEALIGNVTAILEYSENMSSPKPVIDLEPHSYEDAVPEATISDPRYIDEAELTPYGNDTAPSNVDHEVYLVVGIHPDENNIRRASFNQTPYQYPSNKPLINYILDNDTVPDFSFSVTLEYMHVVQVVLNNPFFGPHPFHLHGHQFWLVGSGKWSDGNYDPERHSLTLDGVKRDTFVIQEHSWAVIRFVADNPGVFIFHCHIDWHALSGLAITFIEAPDKIREEVEYTNEVLRVCRMHDYFDDFHSTIAPTTPSSASYFSDIVFIKLHVTLAYIVYICLQLV